MLAVRGRPVICMEGRRGEWPDCYDIKSYDVKHNCLIYVSISVVLSLNVTLSGLIGVFCLPGLELGRLPSMILIRCETL